MKFTLKNLAIREKFILFAQRLFDFILLGNIVFWGGFGIIFFGEDRYNWSPISFIIWVIGGLSTLGIVFRRKELSQKQGFLKFWNSSFLYITGYFKNAPQEQEGIEPSPRKKLQIKRFIIAGSVLLLLVTSGILIIHYREGNQKMYSSWLDKIDVSVDIPSSDVELFDMLLDGTGGYGALSGRVKNKSMMEVKEIKLSITLHDLTGKPIDSGTAIISCSIPPFAVRSVTGNVTQMTPPPPIKRNFDYFREMDRTTEIEKKGWTLNKSGSITDWTWAKPSFTWNYQVNSVFGKKVLAKGVVESLMKKYNIQ